MKLILATAAMVLSMSAIAGDVKNVPTQCGTQDAVWETITKELGDGTKVAFNQASPRPQGETDRRLLTFGNQWLVLLEFDNKNPERSFTCVVDKGNGAKRASRMNKKYTLPTAWVGERLPK